MISEYAQKRSISAMKSRQTDGANSMKFSRKIALLCAQKGWTRLRLANEITGTVVYGRQLKVGKSTVGYWFNGKSVPGFHEIVALTRIFGVTADYLVSEEVNEAYGSAQSEDDRTIIRVCKASGLSADDVIALVMGATEGRGRGGDSVPVSDKDLSESRKTRLNHPHPKGKPKE